MNPPSRNNPRCRPHLFHLWARIAIAMLILGIVLPGGLAMGTPRARAAASVSGSWNPGSRMIGWSISGRESWHCYRLRLVRPDGTQEFSLQGALLGATGGYPLPAGRPLGTYTWYLDETPNWLSCSNLSQIASAAVQVTGSAPACIDRHVTPFEKTPLTITLSAFDLDDQATTLRISSGPSDGVLGPLGPVSCSSVLGVRTCSADVTYLPTGDGTWWDDDFYFVANDGQSDSAPGRVHITVVPDPANDPPTARAGGPYTGDEGIAVAFDGSATSDPDSGDTLTYNWDFGDGSAAASGATPTHTYAQDGTYTVQLTVHDGDGATDSDSTTATIGNVVPVVDGGADAGVDEGATFSQAGSFTDPGADTWTATVDYGDGSGEQSLALNADKTFTLSHAYADNGTYTVTVTVSDDDGEGSDTVTVTVANVAPTATLTNDGPINDGGTVTVSFSGQSDPSSIDTAAGFHYAFALDGAPFADTTYAGNGSTASRSYTFADGLESHVVHGLIIDKDGGSTEYTTTVTVNNVPPTTTITLDPAAPNGLNGWYTTDVQVTLSASDGGSGVASTEYSFTSATGPWTTYSGPFDVTASGTTVVYYRSTDNAGNVEAAQSASIKIDKRDPLTTAMADPAPNAAGWNNSDVTVTLAAVDQPDPGGSGIARTEYRFSPTSAWTAYTAPFAVTAEGTTTVYFRSVDVAGNIEGRKTLTLQIDKTAPTLVWGTPSPAANAAGWNNSDVSIPYTADDGLSGVATTNPASPLVLSSEGAAVTGTVTVTDAAGNSETFTSAAFKIDKTPPALNISAPREGEYGICTPPRRPRFSPADSLSGLDGSEHDEWNTGGRTYTYTAYATDVAGNTSVETRTYTLIAGCNRVDVSVILLGAWNGTPVDAYVGGSRQETLFSAPDAFGRQAVLWTFYPPRCSDEKWSVSVAPQLPAGLESPRWQYRLVRVETPSGSESTAPLDSALAIEPCKEYVLYFQLVDNGPAPAPQASPEAALGGSSTGSAGGTLEIPLLPASDTSAAPTLEPAADIAQVVLSLEPPPSAPSEPATVSPNEAPTPGLAGRIAGAWQALLAWLRGLFGR